MTRADFRKLVRAEIARYSEAYPVLRRVRIGFRTPHRIPYDMLACATIHACMVHGTRTVGPTVVFSDRMMDDLVEARGQVVIPAHLMEEYRREVITHELAHIVADTLDPKSRKSRDGHTAFWRGIHRSMGGTGTVNARKWMQAAHPDHLWEVA